MPKTLVRTNLMLPKSLLEALDRRAENRSEYVRRVLEKSLSKEKINVTKAITAIEKARGAWSDNTEGLEIIRKVRRKNRARTRRLLKHVLQA